MNRLNDSERELALHYAPRENRAPLRCLWAIDERMGAIVAGTSEAAIGEMRLLWWREAIEGLGEKVPAESLLSETAAVIGANSRHASEWGALAEGWHALLETPIDTAELERFGRERGGRLFTLSASLLGDSIDGIEQAGAGWALTDLAANSSTGALGEQARAMAEARLAEFRSPKWPVRLRALGALVALARRDVVGDPRGRRQGSPGRIARMVWHRLTGR